MAGVGQKKGYRHSIEAKKKMSDSHLGKTTWNKGLTKETDVRVRAMGLATGDGKRGWSWKGDQRKHWSGITIAEYKKLSLEQNNICAICGKPETRNVSKREGVCNLAVDHSHTTGKIRGLLCHRCNVALGLFMDNEEIIIKAVNYLKERN